MSMLKNRFDAMVETGEYQEMPNVQDAYSAINLALEWIESEIGRDKYVQIEDAIITAIKAQELSGFITGYLTACSDRRKYALVTAEVTV